MAEERIIIHIGIVGEDSAKEFGFELIRSLAKLPNVELITTPEEHSLKLKFCTVEVVFTDLKKLASPTTHKFDGGITFWKIEDHTEATPAQNSNDDIGTLQKVGIFKNDHIVQISSQGDLKSLIGKIHVVIINTAGFLSSPQYQSYTDAFKDITKHFQNKNSASVPTTSSSSGETIPFYRKNSKALSGMLYSALISIGVFIGFAFAGLLATWLISVPIVFAVLAIGFLVKIVMDNQSPSVSSHATDDTNWPQRLETSESTPSKKLQNVFVQEKENNQKFIKEQVENFEDFLRQQGFDKDCFFIDVCFPFEGGPILQCGAANPDLDLHNQQLKKLRETLTIEKKFIYDEDIQGLTISVADFEEIYKPNISSKILGGSASAE